MPSAELDASRSLDMSHDEDSDTDEVDLESSELGTHAYWQQAYARELEVLQELGDEGEIWCPTAQCCASAGTAPSLAYRRSASSQAMLWTESHFCDAMGIQVRRGHHGDDAGLPRHSRPRRRGRKAGAPHTHGRGSTQMQGTAQRLLRSSVCGVVYRMVKVPMSLGLRREEPDPCMTTRSHAGGFPAAADHRRELDGFVQAHHCVRALAPGSQRHAVEGLNHAA